MERRLSLRVVMMPRDTNHYGTIFGGVILSYIDQAGLVEALEHGRTKWVTVAMDRVEFKEPVHVGDVVNFHTRAERLGRTSITVRVEVEAERREGGALVPVTAASITMVSVGPDERPVPFRVNDPGPRPPEPARP
ncbi:MAG: acyl-CoA thioesterase [Phycisphaeraceae bacterium]|nr:MAG: acyl-CoA thioesterase [Phycisphaeraceae bacterium]